MSKLNSKNDAKLNRRQALLLSASAGAAALAGTACGSGGGKSTVAPQATAASCSTPRTAVAKTQYGKVRGYVEDGVLTFKGVPYGADTGGENRWLPAKPPKPWEGEYPALTLRTMWVPDNAPRLSSYRETNSRIGPQIIHFLP